MLESNRHAQSMLQQVLAQSQCEANDRSTDQVRDYQEQVRLRLKEKKYSHEKKLENNVAYIATTLPSAMDMHRFLKQMRRD